MIHTVKGQSRSDSLLLSPYHWAKLFRGVVAIVAVPMGFAMICWVVLEAFVGQIHVFRWVLGWPYYIWFAEVVLWLSHRLSLLLFSCFPLFTPSYSFSNQAILAEWLFVMQSSAGRRAVCSGSGGLSHDCYAATLYPSRPSPCVLMDCCDPPVTRSWRLFRKRFIHIQENCSDFSPRL